MAQEKPVDPTAAARDRHGRVALWAAQYTFDKLPPEFVLTKSSDGKTVVMNDGTKLTAENMRAAAADLPDRKKQPPARDPKPTPPLPAGE